MVRGNKFKPQPAAAAPQLAAAAPPPLPPPPTAAPGPASSHAVTLPKRGVRQQKHATSHPAKRKLETAVLSASPPATPIHLPRKKHAVPTSTAAGAPGANWAAIKAANLVPVKRQADGTRERPTGHRRATVHSPRAPPSHPAPPARPDVVGSAAGATRILAIDCEMVGVGPGGARSSLARVCVVNDGGAVLLDTHVAQVEPVTDWRTRVSGITPACVARAPPPDAVRARVASLAAGRVLVGHAITHDLKALLLAHPRSLLRDTARYPPFMRATAPGRRPRPRRLRDLAAEHLGLAIQDGAHSPVDDARAALYLYKRHRRQWEAALARGGVHTLAAPVAARGARRAGDAAAAALARLAERDEMAE